ncbi:MAG: glycoside hydrolase family 27 protein [Clostridia bacterium]|nr:glycoside hydrolase family 27 protein [Clostridia bacterium]
MVKHTPAMGWNSWNTFTENINEQLILDTAKVLIDSGLKDAGYEYVVIDDCWSKKERDENGKLVADPEKFPHGIKYVADKIHEMGLKFGMYSCAGTLTCAGYPASYDHEFTDAQTFAEWGVDYLKYDYCFHSVATPGQIAYKRMGLALATCGRDILFSNCSWGTDDTKIWIKETGANSFRSTGDIMDSWKSIKNIAQTQLKVMEYNGQGCFNDMDMLVCGMHGKGTIALNEGCTDDEYFTHFVFWCIMASPLIIGCDIRKLDDATKKYLMNKDLIRINQDTKGAQPFFLNPPYGKGKNRKLSDENPFFYEDYQLDTPVLARLLDDGKIAIGIFNFTDGDAGRWQTSFNTETLGLPETTGKTLLLKDVVSGEKFTVKNGCFYVDLGAHKSKVFIAEVVNK